MRDIHRDIHPSLLRGRPQTHPDRLRPLPTPHSGLRESTRLELQAGSTAVGRKRKVTETRSPLDQDGLAAAPFAAARASS